MTSASTSCTQSRLRGDRVAQHVGGRRLDGDDDRDGHDDHADRRERAGEQEVQEVGAEAGTEEPLPAVRGPELLERQEDQRRGSGGRAPR